jgi:hypothetical protein
VRGRSRGLRRRPAFTLITLLTVALGIGAATNIHTIVDGVLLRPLPFPHPGRLVQVDRTFPAWKKQPILESWWNQIPLSVPEYRLLRDDMYVLSSVALWQAQRQTLTGGGEVARYIGRHGTARVARAVLLVAVPPLLLKTRANPEGLPIEVFDNLRAGLARDRSQFYRDFAIPFYGTNRSGGKVSQGLLDQFWAWSMQSGLLNSYECIKAFSETDFTQYLKQFDIPTLLLHGEYDQIVPVKDSSMKSARLIKGAKDIYFPGTPHGLTATHQDRVNAELLQFLRSAPAPRARERIAAAFAG